jgi:pimeloyl-ACP methyl ester carboxylesterase
VSVSTLVHGRARLALHRLREGTGRPLLLLHGLGESSPASVPPHLASWPGPVDALDFTGHGASSRPKGGGYTAEVLMADVDAAMEHLGEATLLGRGLGAYVALLAGAARPAAVKGIILTDGPGLVGGGVRPSTPYTPPPSATASVGPAEPDPLALLELSHDVRPPDYAGEYVRLLLGGTALERPISVTTRVRPEWLVGVLAEAGDRAVDGTVAEALDRYAAVP